MAGAANPLNAFKKEGALLLKNGAVKNLFFSFGSYQAEMQDPRYSESLFSFIQINKEGEVKDFFCTCRESEEGHGCKHLAALHLVVEGPLQERYDRSIYKALVRLFFEKEAKVPSLQGKTVLIEDIGKITLKTDRGAFLFEDTFWGENAEELQGLWGLSLEEGEKWKQPDKRKELLFEQSSWNEWGKKLAFLKVLQEPKVSLKTDKDGLPHSLTLDFNDLKFEAAIPLTDLPALIPYLEEVQGYPVLEEGKRVLHYHEKSGIVEISLEKIERGKRGALYLPGWVFFRNEGFVPEEAFFPSTKILLKKQIPDFLRNGGIETKVAPIRYTLSFDKEWNLTISAYLFKDGDLQREGSWLQEDYAYIAGDGFYHVDEDIFHQSKLVIPKQMVASFIHEKRSWLSQIPGFDIHFAPLMSETTYEMNQVLTFTRQNHLHHKQKMHDFGTWIYVEDIGFYPRESAALPFLIKPGTSVSKEHIPLFIKERREELRLIKGFFLSDCPVDNAVLDITTSRSTLSLKPVYQIKPNFQEKEIIFFEDIVYVPKEGFFELPPHLRLPEEWRSPRVVEKDELVAFFDEELEKLRRFIPIMDARLKRPSSLKLFISKASPDKNRGQGWYKIKVFWGSEYGTVDFMDVWQGKVAKEPYLFTQAGLIDLKQERFRWLGILNRSKVDKKTGMISVSTLDFYRLDALEGMECRIMDPKDAEETEEIINRLRQFKVAEKLDLSFLQCDLRPYQLTGVEWLWFLYVHGLSGLLCDDMGLGKTHQAMALISCALMSRGNEKDKILVVCPASVIHHWEDKIQAFMPKLKGSIYHGLDRSYEEIQASSNIIITTYGVIRRDIHLFEKTAFILAIYDEIQIAKNKESRIHTVLKRVKAAMKLGLTGTPIENTLFELKSLFDIVLPHYMGADSEFKARFAKPIQKDRDEGAKSALRKLIRPFTLRRKKTEVLLELPEKTEEVSHCDLSKEQADLYNAVLERRRGTLLKTLSEDTGDIPYFHIFALLTELKKICDHPALFLGKALEYDQHESGKWNLFLELLSEAFESGQKVVVFTQYLGMLDIMAEHLTQIEVSYAMIKGSTKNRGEEIKRFNTDEKCRVFLGSLLAGGLGIDLVGGSIVIHYDRWWNAAREMQATDRVHRIGQKRGVQVFKLVTKNTFEERIDEIIREKGKLAEDIVTTEESALKSFNRHELRALLEFSKWDQLE